MVARHRCRLRRCTCQLFRNSPPSAPIHPWHFPDHPWSRIHIDFVGPFLGKMFFVIIDAHSKWMEIHTMASGTNASATIEKLRQTFAIFGLPQELVSDNAPGFASQSFQMFMFENGIKHIKAALCHPASNGLADRAVQTFKIINEKTIRTIGNQAIKILVCLSYYPANFHWSCSCSVDVQSQTLYPPGPLVPSLFCC